ncbi:matrixin family metalloprotease [uncultured Psychroserpens sp.]|uniref:matrixin family metalloprotease n=1 Tax=uncultured Psychroserpens sp. TaxID=255436 RepID=UPI00260441E3|nr:matrixin family metalloprotease [uncultured Psychroserpens sp.]
MKQQYLLVFTLLITLHFQAQECSSLMEPVSLQARTNEATLIVEGEVINSNSYWDVDHKNIYTIHEVTVYKNAKGTNATTVFVETQGGQVGDLIQEVSSAARLRIGYEGIFFLKPSNHSFSIPQTTYKMVAAAQGYIKYNRIENNASDVFNNYLSIENDLYSKLEQATNKRLTVIKGKQRPAITNLRRATPVISSFSPTTITAGTQSILTINGSNFGSTQGEVSFKSANSGGSSYIAAQAAEIISWSNTQIQIEVPSTAGTGTIRVTNATNETVTSSASVTIRYSHLNTINAGIPFPTVLQDDNGSGGFTFEYHTGFVTTQAETYFEDALALWNCQSGVNFQIATETTTIDEIASDNVNVVRFDNGELPSGVLGAVSRFMIACSSSSKGIIVEMDITWNESVSWYYGYGSPGPRYDFKTVALHEIGHAHQLGHVIDPNAVMHYNLSISDVKFELTSDDIDAANYTMDIFAEDPGCGYSVSTANSQCTYVPDDNFEAYLEANGMGNGIANDDLVTKANISGVTFLSVIGQGISDFTGIEDFMALETLYAMENPMSSLDVTANINLKELWCSFSTALTSLNISTLTALETLEISSTGITAIDLSNNTVLNRIWAGAPGLTSLDVSNNLLLDFLHISNSSITNLDLSLNTVLTQFRANNSALESLNIKNGNNANVTTFSTSGSNNLTCATVDNVAYSTTHWTSINNAVTFFSEDCNATTYVPDDNFENYLETHDASGNTVSMGDASSMGNGIANDDTVFTYRISNLTELTLNDLGITDLTGIEDFLGLVIFKSWRNNLTSVAFTNNIHLEDLRVTENEELTAVDISSLTLLKEFWCYDTGLTTLDVSNNIALETLFVFNANIPALDISTNTTLIDLRCNGNQLTSLDVSNNPLLEILVAGNNSISAITLNNLVDLRLLNLSNNNLTALDLKANTDLEELFITDNELTALDIRNGNNTAIVDNSFRTSGNPNLTCINVDNEVFATQTWTTHVDTTTSFNEHCDETYVPDDNFETYLETHDINGAIVNLGDVSSLGNGVMDDYVTTASINAVTALGISGLNISDLTGIEDFIALEVLLCSNNNLATIDVNFNTSLRVLVAMSNGLTSVNIENITALQFLNLHDNALTSLDFTSFPNLTGLIVSNNNLTSLDIRNGANALMESNSDFNATGNPNLTCINVDDENFSTTTWENIDTTALFSEHCGLTYVPDDNFETRLIELGYDSGPLDDYVPTDLISGVTFLNVSSRSIADLTGIEDFTALETIFCNNNNLTTINTSQNIALINLRCYGNQISALDLSANTNLQYLSSSPNNLTTLDLQFNTALIEAFLNNNDLVELNLDNCVALERLQIKGNNLSALSLANGNNLNVTEFDAENNPNLTCINVDDATASYLSGPSWLKDATASYSEHCNDTYIPDDNFENYLETHDASGNTVAVGDPTSMGNGIANDDYVTTAKVNTVTSLDVSSKAIADLTGIEDFEALTELFCRSNSLTSLDVTNNTQLATLSCQNNALTSIDVSQNPLLVTLRIGNNNLANLDVTQNPLLVTLTTSDNTVSSIDVTQNPLLEILSCHNNFLTNLDVTQNPLLEDLDLADNSVINIDVTSNPNLVYLFCDKNDLTSIDVTQNPLLKEFDLGNNQITSLDLSQNIVLEELYADDNNLRILNAANGNNMAITDFEIDFNPNLTCVLVDDAAYSLEYWDIKDNQTSYNDVKCETYVPDDNFENYLETHNDMGDVVPLGDSSSLGNGIANDNYVTTAHIDQAQSLDVSNENIADLTGIEDFVLLLDLNCSNNQLTALYLSSNTELDNLYANDNNITTLSLEANGSLDQIYVQNNDLSTLSLADGTSEDNLGFDATGNPNLYCIKVGNVASANAVWSDFIDPQTSFSDTTCETVFIAPKVFLQGATLNPNTGEENLMRDDLRVANLIPTLTPYNDEAIIDAGVFLTTGDNAIVDWVWVEIIDQFDVLQIEDTQSALLQRDGDVVGLDGVSNLRFNIAPDNYYVVIKHRNHLGIMTSNTIALSSTVTAIDFTDANNPTTYGTNAQTTFGMPSGVVAMWAGDVNGDAIVQYSGTNPDVPDILSSVLNDVGNFLNLPTYSISGYLVDDVNMDGNIQYSGTNPDTPFILQNVLAHPGNFLNFSTYQIQEQILQEN